MAVFYVCITNRVMTVMQIHSMLSESPSLSKWGMNASCLKLYFEMQKDFPNLG